MPGDAAVLKGVPAALSATNLLMAVAVKLPLFWPENLKTWIVQTESQFRLKGVVVSQTKCNVLLHGRGYLQISGSCLYQFKY